LSYASSLVSVLLSPPWCSRAQQCDPSPTEICSCATSFLNSYSHTTFRKWGDPHLFLIKHTTVKNLKIESSIPMSLLKQGAYLSAVVCVSLDWAGWLDWSALGEGWHWVTLLTWELQACPWEKQLICHIGTCLCNFWLGVCFGKHHSFFWHLWHPMALLVSQFQFFWRMTACPAMWPLGLVYSKSDHLKYVLQFHNHHWDLYLSWGSKRLPGAYLLFLAHLIW
jgi:hypothetical protein